MLRYATKINVHSAVTKQPESTQFTLNEAENFICVTCCQAIQCALAYKF